MDNKSIVATLKARLFNEHGTEEVNLKNPVVTGTQDWRAGGGNPTCIKVRAKSKTEFEWYLNDWAYGWYGENSFSNGVSTENENGEMGYLDDNLKIKILTQALATPKNAADNDDTPSDADSTPSKAAKMMVAGQIVGMFINNILYECGMESFIGWLEDGDAFYNTDYPEKYTDEEIEEAIRLAKEIAPMVDELSWKLNVESGE